MHKVEIALSQEVADQLGGYAAAAGLPLDQFLSQGLEHRAAELLPRGPKAWMPREQWDALVRGEGCPLCTAIASDEQADAWGHTIADLGMGRLRLATNQSVPGYCVLICKRHVREPFELSVAERGRFWEDMMRAGQALEQVFGAAKMNFEILGNLVPHLHCHIKPRYYGDPAPGAPIHPDMSLKLLTQEEYRQQAALIREALHCATLAP